MLDVFLSMLGLIANVIPGRFSDGFSMLPVLDTITLRSVTILSMGSGLDLAISAVILVTLVFVLVNSF